MLNFALYFQKLSSNYESSLVILVLETKFLGQKHKLFARFKKNESFLRGDNCNGCRITVSKNDDVSRYRPSETHTTSHQNQS